jgi:hypothetical protein
MTSDRQVDALLQRQDTTVDLNTVATPKDLSDEEPSAWWVLASQVVAATFGLGCGFVGAAALLAVGQPLWLALSLGTFSFISNFVMTKENVKTVLLGGIDELFKEAEEEDNDEKNKDKDEGKDKDKVKAREYLSLTKQRLVKVGIFLAMTFGMTMAALTYVAAVKLATLALLAPIAPALPAIGAVLAVVTLITQCSLMTVGFVSIIRINDLWGNTKSWFDDNFNIAKKEVGKSNARFIAERVIMAAIASTMLIPVILLISWGKTETLASCAVGLSEIIQKVPYLSSAIVNWSSFIIAQVLALAAQIPFVLTVTVTPMLAAVNLVEKSFKIEPKDKKSETATTTSTPAPAPSQKIVTFFKIAGIIIASFFNSACMAAIAMQGKPEGLATTLGGAGAFTDGFVSSSVNGLKGSGKKTKNISKDINDLEAPKNSSQSSTARACNSLGVTPSPSNDRTQPAAEGREDERAIFTNPSPINGSSLSSAQSSTRLDDSLTQTRKVM